MKKNVAVVLSAVVTAAVLGSCTDPKGAGEEHFIKVDDAELSFLADDSRSVTVDVRAYPAEWSVESDASWIRYTESEGAVAITVAPNTGDAERKGVITVTAGQARQDILDDLLRVGEGFRKKIQSDIVIGVWHKLIPFLALVTSH